MNKLRISVFFAIAVFISLFVANQAGAFSIRELLGLDDEDKQEQAAESQNQQQAASRHNWGKPGGDAAAANIDLAELERVLANVDAKQRQVLLSDQAAFKQFVQQEANNLSVLTAARVNNVDKDANTAFLMQRSADNVMRESYLNKLIASKTPKDFPSEAQAREYFEKNKEKFVVPERVHVWQVFIKTTEQMIESDIAAAKKQAESISKNIRSGKVSFADAASQYSDHKQSKVSGGYMGLVKVSDLKPEISKPLLGLPEDRTSTPIKTETGFHVVKRGARVPALNVEFEQVSGQIRQLLLKQVRTQLRQAIYQQAGKTYPVILPEAQVEEWRTQLQSKAGGG